MTYLIKKLVIPVAGLGTRFLPATKAQPKEMMPVVDKPIIQYVVEEAVASGITDIIMITGPGKRAVEEHFSPNYELIEKLKRQGKISQAEELKKIADLANFIYVRQRGPYGNGTPVLCARSVIGNETFAVLWGDEFIYAKPPRLKQCLDVFAKYGDPVISGIRVPKDEVNQYGIARVSHVKDNVFLIDELVEKPDVKSAPSNLATHGCYILTPDIFPKLEQVKPGKDGEIWLVDAIKDLMKERKVYACEIKNGIYYDTGSKFGYIRANIDFALRDKVLGKKVRKYLKSIL